MKNIFSKILIITLLLGCFAPIVVAQKANEPKKEMSAQDKQKAKEKAQKEKEKAKAQQAKEKEKAKAQQAKEKEKAKAQQAKEKEKAKAQQTKEKEKAQQQAAAEKAKADKQREAEKAQAEKQRESDKAKAEKQREADRAKAEKQREADKAQAERERVQAQREAEQAKKEAEAAKRQAAIEKEIAQKEAEDEAMRKAWLRQQALQNDPSEMVTHYINLSGRLGYAALMDKMPENWSNANYAYQLGSTYAYQSLKGGPGAGITASYELAYKAFRFETGIDFKWLNSTSDYGFTLTRTLQTYPGTYSYLFDDLREVRNVGYLSLPIMFGAQFERYYFMLGAKVGYGLFNNYKQSGRYDITVKDNVMIEPYGLGIHDIPASSGRNYTLKQPDVSICAEVGVDLDEWMQKEADPAQLKGYKPGQRLPFGPQHLHYKVSAFAEYGVLNTNNPAGVLPLNFNSTGDFASAALPASTNSMLDMAGTKVNNLFVGLKFTVQFEIPGKVVPTPPSYARYTIADADTDEQLPSAMFEVTDTKTNRVVIRSRKLPKAGFLKQLTKLGEYSVTVKNDLYFPTTISYAIDSVGIVVPVDVKLKRWPMFRVTVLNLETEEPLASNVEITPRGSKKVLHKFVTDTTTGSSTIQLIDSLKYDLHISHMGFEPYDGQIQYFGDTLLIKLNPIKKGVTFIVKNMFFATNKTRILPTSEEALDGLYQFLASDPSIRIKIIGHTDNVGSDADNQILSDGRANAVRDELISRGIAADRIEAEGRGESQPIDTNETDEGRQNNRRVEIEIL